MSSVTSPIEAPPDRSSVRARGSSVILLLTAALLALGLAPMLMPDSYSWVEHGVSESAGQGLEGAWLARIGFIVFGLAVLWLVILRRASWGLVVSSLHLVFAVSMFGVAAFPTRPWDDDVAFVESEDLLHTVFASAMGFAFITGVVMLIVARRERSAIAAVWDWAALLVTMVVPLTMSTGIWGLLQRIMFLSAGAWYGREAWLADHRIRERTAPRSR